MRACYLNKRTSSGSPSGLKILNHRILEYIVERSPYYYGLHSTALEPNVNSIREWTSTLLHSDWPLCFFIKIKMVSQILAVVLLCI